MIDTNKQTNKQFFFVNLNFEVKFFFVHLFLILFPNKMSIQVFCRLKSCKIRFAIHKKPLTYIYDVCAYSKKYVAGSDAKYAGLMKDTVEKIFWNLNFAWSFVYCSGYASHYNIFLFIYFFIFILVICVCLFSLSWLHILQNMLLYDYLRNRILIKMTLKRRQNERKGELYEI